MFHAIERSPGSTIGNDVVVFNGDHVAPSEIVGRLSRDLCNPPRNLPPSVLARNTAEWLIMALTDHNNKGLNHGHLQAGLPWILDMFLQVNQNPEVTVEVTTEDGGKAKNIYFSQPWKPALPRFVLERLNKAFLKVIQNGKDSIEYPDLGLVVQKNGLIQVYPKNTPYILFFSDSGSQLPGKTTETPETLFPAIQCIWNILNRYENTIPLTPE